MQRGRHEERLQSAFQMSTPVEASMFGRQALALEGRSTEALPLATSLVQCMYS